MPWNRFMLKMIARLSLFSFLPSSLSALAQGGVPHLKPNELAVVLGAQWSAPLLLSSPEMTLLTQAQYNSILQKYAQTSIGEAWVTENQFQDWRLVSMRVDPCSPLVLGLDARPAFYCWPEVRLVATPVLKEYRKGNQWTKWWTDDRALHLIYPLPVPSELQTIVQSIQTQAAQRGVVTLSEGERDLFTRARNQSSLQLLKDVSKLTLAPQPAQEISTRPELAQIPTSGPFREGLLNFLRSYSAPDRLKKVTAFSLPEGRNPSPSDDWVFLNFEVSKGNLRLTPIVVHHQRTGQPLVTLDGEQSASSGRDDSRVYEQWEDSPQKEQVEKQIMLFKNNPSYYEKTINDGNQILVPNTTCASCHKLNPDQTDFHNFSSFLDNPFTISNRVKSDVKRNLAWIEDNLK
jgi:hypothetical protein